MVSGVNTVSWSLDISKWKTILFAHNSYLTAVSSYSLLATVVQLMRESCEAVKVDGQMMPRPSNEQFEVSL